MQVALYAMLISEKSLANRELWGKTNEVFSFISRLWPR